MGSVKIEPYFGYLLSEERIGSLKCSKSEQDIPPASLSFELGCDFRVSTTKLEQVAEFRVLRVAGTEVLEILRVWGLVMAKSYEKYAIRDRAPDPKKAVLLVIDMQEYFRGMAAPILPAIRRTIELARGAQMPVIYTQHLHKGPSDYGMLYEWWNGNVIEAGYPEVQLMPEVHKLEVGVISLSIVQLQLVSFGPALNKHPVYCTCTY